MYLYSSPYFYPYSFVPWLFMFIEKLDHFSRFGHGESRVARFVNPTDIGAKLKERPGHVQISRGRCHHEGRPAIFIDNIDVGAMLNEKLGHAGEVRLVYNGKNYEKGLSLVDRVNFGAMIYERLR